MADRRFRRLHADFSRFCSDKLANWPQIELLAPTQVAGPIDLKAQLILHERWPEASPA